MLAGLQAREEEGMPSASGSNEAPGKANGHIAGSSNVPNGHSGQLGAAERPLPWLWWAARVLAVQQRALSGPAASLQTAVSQLMPQASVFLYLLNGMQ